MFKNADKNYLYCAIKDQINRFQQQKIKTIFEPRVYSVILLFIRSKTMSTYLLGARYMKGIATVHFLILYYIYMIIYLIKQVFWDHLNDTL